MANAKKTTKATRANRTKLRTAKANAQKSTKKPSEAEVISLAMTALTTRQLDFNGPVAEEILQVLQKAGNLADALYQDVETLEDADEDVVFNQPLMLLSPKLYMLGDAPDVATVFVLSGAVDCPTMMCLDLTAFAGMTANEIAARFMANKNEMLVALTVFAVCLNAIEHDRADHLTVKMAAEHMERIFLLLGIPRVTAS